MKWITPGDAEYDATRELFNRMIDRRPAMIARCETVADVRLALEHAREHSLEVAVRSGGHSVAGMSTNDGGIVIDVRPMKSINISVDDRTATVGGGVTWGEFDTAAHAVGLVVTGGRVSTTGVSGFTLNGGSGWLERAYGLACDSLVRVELVTADGEEVIASATENPDLFWALHGGGGNFGVVTSFTFRCHPVGPMVAFAGVFHPVADAENVYRQFRDWAQTGPDEISAMIGCTTLPASPNIPPEIHDTPMIVTGAVFSGDPEEGMRIVQPLRDIGTPLVDISGPLPFAGVQAAFDEFFQRGTLRSYWKATYVDELTDPILDIVVDRARNRPSARTFVVTFLMGGAINRVEVDETAYSERSANWMVSMDGNWEDASDDDSVISWVRGAWGQVHELGTGSLYLNFSGVSDEAVTTGVESAFDKANLQRLEEIKAHYDPDNFFRRNNNILPAG